MNVESWTTITKTVEKPDDIYYFGHDYFNYKASLTNHTANVYILNAF